MKLFNITKRYVLRFLMIVKYYKYVKDDILIHPLSELGNATIIGKGTNINGKCFISSARDATVSIGSYCAIAHNMRIRNRNHNMNYPNLQDKFQNRHHFKDLTVTKGNVVIGNACWIGDNVTILPGVVLGDGVVVGAGSVVTKSFDSYSIIAGNPAKLLRMRFPDQVINQLKNIRWWEWDENKISENSEFFNTDLSNKNDRIEIN